MSARSRRASAITALALLAPATTTVAQPILINSLAPAYLPTKDVI